MNGKGARGAVVEGFGTRAGGFFVSVRALVVLFVLLVAVLHGDALHASFPHRGGGLLHGQPVAHRIVHLAVEGGVEDALQAEVPVLFLRGGQRYINISVCVWTENCGCFFVCLCSDQESHPPSPW